MDRGGAGIPLDCRGLLGKMFGHKFIKRIGGYIYESDRCYRCGYVPAVKNG